MKGGDCVRVSLCVSVRHWNARGSSGVGETLTSFTSTSSSLLGCGESTHAGEVNAVTWPPVAVGEFPPLWRKGQPCGWTVSPTPVLVLCLEGGVLFLFFFNVSPQQPGFFSTRRHSSLSAKPWRTAAWICPPCLKRLETSWLSWIWSCLKVKEGRGADGGDAVADCQASCVCLSCLGWPA